MSVESEDENREAINTELLQDIKVVLLYIARILEEVHETGLILDDVEEEIL